VIGHLPGHAEREEKIAEHLANRRVRPLIPSSRVSQARSA
jgi:hypothetical protein